jgi:hypothetical protein
VLEQSHLGFPLLSSEVNNEVTGHILIHTRRYVTMTMMGIGGEGRGRRGKNEDAVEVSHL